MADHFVPVADLPEGGEKFAAEKVSKFLSLTLVVGVVGAVVSLLALLGVFGDYLRDCYAYSYLFGFSVTFSIIAGGFFWVLLHHAINAGWGIAVRRIWEAFARLIPLAFLFALPFFLPTVQDPLWEWMQEHRETKAHMQEAEVASAQDAHSAHNGHDTHHGGLHDALLHDHKILLAEKYGYLNIPFWTGRILFYFLSMWCVMHFLLKWPLLQERDGDLGHTFRVRRLACGGLVIFAVSVSFWAIDFLKVLDYAWFSTMWGVYVFAGCAWSSMALSILVINFLRSQGYLQTVVTAEHYHTMGKLLLAFTIFWAYIAYDQFFLIWYANITEETKFYLIRNTDQWHYVSLLLFVGHFVVPFICLLFVWLKKTPKLIGLVCAWVLFMHLVDHYWMIIPERGISILEVPAVTAKGAWIGDVVALVTFVACFGHAYVRGLIKHSLYPWRDPRLQESVNLHN
jgi:hypothetical protein